MILGYNAFSIFDDIENLWYKLYEIPMKMYAFVEMIDSECNSEEFFYDIWYFCSYNNCGLEKMLENDVKHLFQITGLLNSMASVVYGHGVVQEETHDFYFDMYEDVGVNMGSVFRVSLAYEQQNPLKIKEMEVQFEQQ